MPELSRKPTILFVTPSNGHSSLISLFDAMGDTVTSSCLVISSEKMLVIPDKATNPMAALDEADLTIFFFFGGEQSEDRLGCIFRRIAAGKPIAFLTYSRTTVPNFTRFVIMEQLSWLPPVVVWRAETGAAVREILDLANNLSPA